MFPNHYPDGHADPSGLAQKYAREPPRKPTRYSYPNAPGWALEGFPIFGTGNGTTWAMLQDDLIIFYSYLAPKMSVLNGFEDDAISKKMDANQT